MFGVTDYAAFVVAVIVFLAIPGPGNLALITSTGKGGVVGGLAATLGVILGDQVLMWAAVAGVATLLAASPVVFGAMQWVGAAYLAWLGWRMLRAKPGQAMPIEIRAGHYLRQAMMITLLNPKAIMFYMAFFPLFIDPAQHRGAVTFAAMAVTIALITAAYCLTLCGFARAIGRQVRAHAGLAKLLERLAGVFLIAFGIRLGTQ